MTTANVTLLNRDQVKERLQIGDSKFHELISSGRLRSVKLDRCRRVPSDAVDEFIAGLTGGEINS